MIKYGLKLRSTNDDVFDKAINFLHRDFFDFIELYIVPREYDINKLDILKAHEINIHLPQGIHGFNPINPESKVEDIWDNIIRKYIDHFNPKYIVMHPEHGDDLSVLKKRLDYFNDKRILIENMPKHPIKGYSFDFFGYTLEQIKQIGQLGYNICLDFEKAAKAAKAEGIEYKTFIGDIMRESNPTYFHISGCNFKTEEDQHLDLRATKFDIKWTKGLLIEISDKKDIFLVLETPRNGNNFDNDIKNLDYFKKITN